MFGWPLRERVGKDSMPRHEQFIKQDLVRLKRVIMNYQLNAKTAKAIPDMRVLLIS